MKPLAACPIPHDEYHLLWRSAQRTTILCWYKWFQNARKSGLKFTDDAHTYATGLLEKSADRGLAEDWATERLQEMGYDHLNAHIVDRCGKILATEYMFIEHVMDNKKNVSADERVCLKFCSDGIPHDNTKPIIISGIHQTHLTYRDTLARCLDQHFSETERHVTEKEFDVIADFLERTHMQTSYKGRNETADQGLHFLFGSDPMTFKYDDKGQLKSILQHQVDAKELAEIVKHPELEYVQGKQKKNPIVTGCPASHAKMKEAEFNNPVAFALNAYRQAAHKGIFAPEPDKLAFKQIHTDPPPRPLPRRNATMPDRSIPQ